MKISALQLSNKSQGEIESYIKVALEAKARVILFGEYLLNPFFKNFIDKVPQLKLNKNERLFGNLAYYKLYLILAIILQIRRG